MGLELPDKTVLSVLGGERFRETHDFRKEPGMPVNVRVELSALERLSVADLRGRFAELFGEPTRATNRIWLIRRLAWRLQALAEGDLSERARRRAAELANDADLRLLPPRAAATTTSPVPALLPTSRPVDPRIPCPGTVLTRRSKGTTLQIHIRERGFEFDGRVYASLSAVARAITGSHCNGLLFFRFTQRGGQP
jgi:hypothetical protein